MVSRKVARLKFKNREYLYAAICSSVIFLIALMIFRNWLLTAEWPAGGDVLGWISRAYIFGKDFRWLYVWRPYSFGFSEGINSMDFLLFFIYNIFKDASFTIKIFVFSSFLVAGSSIYIFAYGYTKKHLAALSASLVYILNQWFFSQLTEAHVNIIFGYALIPLVFLFLDKVLKSKNFKNILIFSIMSALFITGFHSESIIIYGFFLFMFVIFYIISLTLSKDFCSSMKNLLKKIPIIFMICFLLSAFLSIPFVMNIRAPYYSPKFGYPIEDSMINSYQNMTDAFVLRAVENWGYTSLIDVYTDFGLPDFPVYIFLLIIFLLAFFTCFIRRDRYTAFFAFSTVISIFLAKGPHPPFGYVFTWAWFNIPHVSVFRAVSRVAMMTSFSQAFFVSVLTSFLTSYVQRIRRGHFNELKLKISVSKTEQNGNVKPNVISISIYDLNKFIKILRKVLYYFSLSLLFFILISGFISCFYFFNQGLQVYTPPQQFIEPLEYLAKKSGDYKIVTVSNSPAEWESVPGAESDFSSSGMLTNIGWGHDIGYDSSFIHDKPVLQDGGWDFRARALVDHLRFRLARSYTTDDINKILGTFNYKYIVVPSYASNNIRTFFLKQQGSKIVYNQSGSLILENSYYTPELFAANKQMTVIGGLESLSSLCKINSFGLNKTAIIFANQMRKSLTFNQLLDKSDELVFVDSDFTDLLMLYQKKDELITLAKYGVSSLNLTKYWGRTPYWREVGALVLGGETLTTSGKNAIDIPFNVKYTGVYDFWIRIAFADNRGKLSIFIDGVPLAEIRPLSSVWSRLRWVNIAHVELRSGSHMVTLKNDGTGYNDVDAIAIVQPSQFQFNMMNVYNTLRNFYGRTIYVLETESAFTENLPNEWVVKFIPYNGYILHSEKFVNISPEGNASASSFGIWDNIAYGAWGANDGSLNTRWASKPPEMPQWLQIEWSTPRELVGIHIVFERAYAEDYVIQTWNGTSWVDQVNVTMNTLTDRTHYFRQPVQTTKLRIYVTSAPAYDLVSIWELETYSTSWVSTNVFIPREGRYMFAFRLASGLDYGTLSVKINNTVATIPCSNSSSKFKWYEIGPVHLGAGNQTISVGGVGKIDFDEMIIYSLKDEEDNVPLSHLFASNPSPQISYEKINPCEYNVHVKNSTAPFLLIFSEAYHPLWRAYLDGHEISPVIAYSVVNGFYINKTGDFDIKIYFTGQIYADIGLKISIVTLVITIIFIIIPSEAYKRITNYIRRKMIVHAK